MDLLGPRLPQKGDDLAAGGPPDDGVVHHDHPLALHLAGQGGELDAHRLLPAGLVGGDKGAAHIAVFHKSHPVGDAALLGVALGGVQAGVGHPDDQVGLHRVLLGQKLARVYPGLVDRLPGDHRVGAGEVDILKDAHVGQSPAVVPDGAHLAVLHHHDLPGLQFPLQFAPHAGDGAGLGGEQDGVPLPAHAQGAEAPGVPAGDELPGGHDQQGEGPLQIPGGVAHRVLHAAAVEPGLGDGVGDELGVAGGVEDGPLVLKVPAELVHPHQIAVVDHRQGALHVLDGQGLGVLPFPRPGGGVAHMAHRHGAVEPVQGLLVKDLAHQAHVLVKGLLPAVDGRDAAGLLPTVLEGVQPVIGGLGAPALRIVDAEYPALLVQAAQYGFHPRALPS